MLGGLGMVMARCSAATARGLSLIAFTIVVGGGVTMMATHAFVAKWGFRGDSPRDGLFYLMDGTAYRPFVYRRLAPDVIRLTTDVALRRLPPRMINYMVARSTLKRYRGYWEGDEI